MAVWTGNLSDVGLGHLAGLNPEIQFHLNAPQVGSAGQVYATKPAKATPASSGAFSVELLDTSVMLDDAWLEMHVVWNEPGTGGASGYSPVDVHVKSPIRTNSAGGSISGAIGSPPTNRRFLYVSLTAPSKPLPSMVWVHMDPTVQNNPQSTGNLYEWRNV